MRRIVTRTGGLFLRDGFLRDGVDTALRIGLGLLALVVAVIALLGPNSSLVERRQTAASELAAAETARPSGAGSPRPDGGLPAPPNGRDVTPVAPPLVEEAATGGDATTAEGLTRAPPRLPSASPEEAGTQDAEREDAEARKADEADTVRLRLLPRPIAIDTATFLLGRARVRLAGIQPVAPSRECGQGARSWPCGMQARTALRLWLRARSIRCAVPEGFGTREEALDAECSLGPKDVGEWLVENGWAEARPEGRYTVLERRAREAGRGIWGNGREAPPPDTQ